MLQLPAHSLAEIRSHILQDDLCMFCNWLYYCQTWWTFLANAFSGTSPLKSPRCHAVLSKISFSLSQSSFEKVLFVEELQSPVIPTGQHCDIFFLISHVCLNWIQIGLCHFFSSVNLIKRTVVQ